MISYAVEIRTETGELVMREVLHDLDAAQCLAEERRLRWSPAYRVLLLIVHH